MSQIPPGTHQGTVTATGWRRENYTLTSRHSFSAEEGGLHVIFIWSYRKKLFGPTRTITISVIPGLGAGYNETFLAYRLKTQQSTVSFSGRVTETPHGTATYDLSRETTDLLDEFFRTHADFQFEVHDPGGAILELPMTNEPAPYIEMTAAIRGSMG